MSYVDVILPLPLEGAFTYRLPTEWAGKVCVGSRLIVPFGANKLYTGIVTALHDNAPQEDYKVKDVTECLDAQPVLLPQQLKFWQWMSNYYMCPEGDVYKAALPSGMKLASETQLRLNNDFEDWDKLTKKEVTLLELLQKGNYKTAAQVQKVMKDNRIMSTLRALMDKGALTVNEELHQAFAPRKEIHVRLAKAYQTEEALGKLAAQLEKTPKRYSLLMKYLELSGLPSALTLKNKKLLQEVSRAELLKAADISAAVLTGMRAKGYMDTYDFETGRLKTLGKAVSEQLPLTEPQQTAYDKILKEFESKKVCLLHGVTSSGKTEIYIRMIRKELEAGRQVLYLLPEIALTTQITTRLRRVFGDTMGVYHSKYPDNERVEIWKKQLSNNPFVLILGVRSSLFLPFQKLGLVIVDEEHETSYKQQEPAPRYNARDASIVLASLYDAHTLLGTATPSMETFHNVKQKKYGYALLDKRFGDMEMPVIEVADVKDLMHRKMMHPPFTPRLEEEIDKALEAGEQVILFQNRRGYTPVVECHNCGWVPTCQFCDVSLTYHQNTHSMVCHYCGTTYEVPTVCPQCGEKELRSLGFGTEKIEEEVQKRFPKARTARLDLDTARTRNSYEKILDDFAERHTDILIGTQMVSKGLDFDNVHVVGILDADTMMTRPDFRSYERSFQMMAQVAGRAGRRGKQGFVILQTKHADYPVVQQVVENDYRAMFKQQEEERRQFLYPPFCRLIYVYLRSREDRVVSEAARVLADDLKNIFGKSVLGPDRPAIARIQMLYYRKIILKVGNGSSTSQVRALLKAAAGRLTKNPLYRSVSVFFDVDPL